MRSISLRLFDLRMTTLNLGFIGENEHTNVTIDCKRAFDQYPDAIPTLTVKPPVGDPYPAVVIREGDMVTWVVTSSDLVYDGKGKIQLSFVQNGIIMKSYKCNTVIEKSIEPIGEAPDPIEDWIIRAQEILGSIEPTIRDALEEAKESGEFDGKDGEPGADGFSPTASVTKSGDTTTVTITDKDSTTSVEIMDGEDGAPGEDGISPTISIDDIADGHTVTITDAEGPHSFDVMNGQKGADGYSPTASVTKSGSTATISITDKNGTTTAQVSDGAPGQDGNDGQPGADGYSPTATVTKSGKTATITITDKNGTTTETVSDGEDGTDIIDDTAGAGDTDKTWSANRLRGVQDLVALPYEELTFPVAMNALCIHDGKLYKSIQAIQTEEAWTPSHWYDVTGGTSITALYTGLDTIGAALAQKYSKPVGGIPASDIAAGVIPDPADLIDDTAGSGDTDKVWSADKSASEKSSTMSALEARYVKPESGIPASDLASGVIPSVPVQDVQVAGTSILQDGVANIPYGSTSAPGLLQIAGVNYGTGLIGGKTLYIAGAVDADIKAGTNGYKPIASESQHRSIYYGLAKLAGADMASVTGETVGVYPEAQRVAIQKMLGLWTPKFYVRTTPLAEDSANISGTDFGFSDAEINIWEELVITLYQTGAGQEWASNDWCFAQIRDVVNNGYINVTDLYLKGSAPAMIRIKRLPSVLFIETFGNNGTNTRTFPRDANYIDKIRWIQIGCNNGTIKSGACAEAYIGRFY